MSLVNTMLQDLQQRSAADSKPLAGLHAVPAGQQAVAPKQARWQWIAGLFVTFFAMTALLWSFTDLTNTSRQAGPAVAEARPRPVIQATAAAFEATSAPDLKTNRLDYYLRSPPLAKIVLPAAVSKPILSVKHTKADATAPGVRDVPQQASSEAVIKTAVSPAVRFRRDGLAALRAGKGIVAERQFRKLVAADPDNPEAHLLLHAALKAQSRSAAARSVLLAGLEHSTDPVLLAQVLANELLAEGRVNHALAVLTAHRPADHADLDYEARLAAVNQRAGNHSAAARLYRQLVERQPANGAWWVGLAISQEATGNVGDAARSFATATAGGTLDVTLARYAAERLARLETGS